MSEPSQEDGASQAGAPQPGFQIEKIYVKDLSVEVPNAPQIFTQLEQPQIEVQVTNQAQQFMEGIFEVTVTVTVTARSGERVLFLVEVAQAGIFVLRGIAPQDVEPVLAIACPTILFPYAREAVSDLVTRSGFPPVLLSPVSFEQIYLQQRGAGAGERRIEIAN